MSMLRRITAPNGLATVALTGALTTNGTTSVVGVGTEFSQSLVGTTLWIGGVEYTVASVQGTTALTTTAAVPAGSGQVALPGGSDLAALLRNFALLDGVKVMAPVPILRRNQHYGDTMTTSAQSGTTRMAVRNVETCHDLRVMYSNWGRNGIIVANPNAISVKASVEIDGVLFPVWFGGRRTVTIDPGATLVSDPVCVSITSANTVFIRTYWDAGAGGYIPTMGPILYGAAYGSAEGKIAAVDYTDSGAITDAGAGALGYHPLTVFATPNVARRPSVMLIGDSIVQGAADTTLSGDSDYDKYQPLGFVSRALTAAGIPSFKVGCGGDQAQFMAASLHLRGPNLYGAKYVVSNYGINDVFHPRTLNQIKADLQKIWAYFAARGAKVYQTTLTPRTSSTDYFYSLANQTVTAQESVRLGVNNWLRDASASGAVAQSGGALAGVFDVSPYCETDGKWTPYATFIYSGTPTNYGANWIEDTTVTGWPGNTAHSLNHGAGLAITAGAGMGTFYAANENSPGNKFYATSGNFSPALDATSRYGLFWTPTNDGIHPNWKANIAMMAAVNTSLLV
jgi:hypothetical protein